MPTTQTTTKQIKSADKTLILATIKRMIRSLDHAALHVKNDDVTAALTAMTGMRVDAGSITTLLEMIRAARVAEAAAYEETVFTMTSEISKAAYDAGKRDALMLTGIPSHEGWRGFTNWAVANNYTQNSLSYEDNRSLWKMYETGWLVMRG